MQINPPNSIFKLLLALLEHISKRRRLQFVILLLVTVAGSIAETISISSMLPFISVLTQPEKIFHHPRIQWVNKLFHISNSHQLIILLTVLFASSAILTALFRLIITYASVRFSNGVMTDLGVEVYRKTLYKPYSFHYTKSPQEINKIVHSDVARSASALMSTINMFTSIFMLFSIIITLVFIDPKVALTAMFSFGTIYFFIALLVKKRVSENTKRIYLGEIEAGKAYSEGLQGIRDVILDSTQKIYSIKYGKYYFNYQKIVAENAIISNSPRYLLEGFAIVLVSLLAYLLTLRPGGVSAALPILATLALGAQRLLPLFHNLYMNWSTFIVSREPLQSVVLSLSEALPSDVVYFEENRKTIKPLRFTKNIKLNDITFKYNQKSAPVLKNINLTINRGSKIGLVGTTGSGKSTTLDMLMGFLIPDDGSLIVDKTVINSKNVKYWQKNISHVPQTITLADLNIAENIAFGVEPEEINFSKVKQAASMAQIHDFIESLPDGYQTSIGDRGARLSGGQRQRIGIARALYKNSNVLVFDEATSALDSATEEAVMDAINQLNKDLTILMIAHRITTLRHCHQIIELDKGKIVFKGTYQAYLTHKKKKQKPKLVKQP